MIAIVRVARALDFAARELAVLRDADLGGDWAEYAAPRRLTP